MHDTTNSQETGREAALSPTLDASNDRLLTTEEIAAVLRLHPGSVRRMVAEERIPCLHVGRSVRYKLHDVLRYFEGGER